MADQRMITTRGDESGETSVLRLTTAFSLTVARERLQGDAKRHG